MNIHNSYISAIAACWLLLLVNSCDYISYINEESEVIIHDIQISDYTQIIIEAPYKIIFIEEETNILSLQGQKHLIKDVDISVNKGILTINHDKGIYIQESKRITIYLHAANLSKITINNITTLESEYQMNLENMSIILNGRGSYSDCNIDINCNKLYFGIYGNDQIGDFNIRGKCINFTARFEGYSNILAEDLYATHISIDHKSMGTCTISATNTLNVNIYSKGNTYYYGSPKVNISRIEAINYSSTGNVYKIKDN